jgi:hypothetical protein
LGRSAVVAAVEKAGMNQRITMSEKNKKDGWDKFQVWINFIAVIVIASIGLIVDSTLKSREVNLKYVEMAVDILKTKPEESPKNIRVWAIDVVNAYSKVPLSSEAQAELKTNSLPGGPVLTTEDGKIITTEDGKAILSE